jgi:predicted O-methyltransferase YrrM
VVIKSTNGMATENKLALLNLAAAHLDPGEVYLEIGTYRGTSLIGASLGTSGERFVAIDDFSQFGGPAEVCRANLNDFGCGDATLISANAWDVLRGPFPYCIGAYFYDGAHSFADQWRAFSFVEPYLADEALIIIDDTSHSPVRAANRAYTAGDRRYQRVASFPAARRQDPRWWNGVDVFAFRRSEPPPQDKWCRRLRYVQYAALYGHAYEFLRSAVLTRAYRAGSAAKRRVQSARDPLRPIRPRRSVRSQGHRR